MSKQLYSRTLTLLATGIQRLPPHGDLNTPNYSCVFPVYSKFFFGRLGELQGYVYLQNWMTVK